MKEEKIKPPISKAGKRQEDRSYGPQMWALVFVAVLLLLAAVPGPEDKVVFLDVGQGDSILLQNGTRQVLIDGGPGMTVLTRLGEEMPWFDRSIEVVVLTHPQQDHMEGLLHVLDRYEVGLVLLPKIAHTSQMQEAWLERIIEKDIDYRFAWAGQRLAVGGLAMRVLGPFDTEAARAAGRANLNNASVMARIDFCPGDDLIPPPGWNQVCMSFLLTGDAEKRVEAMLVSSVNDPSILDVDVLKAGHHGSKTSTNEILLSKASPAAAVISVGEDNKFGHPAPEALARLAGVPVWRTDQLGSVRFKLAGGKQWIIGVDGKSGLDMISYLEGVILKLVLSG